MEIPLFSVPLSGWDLATWRIGESDPSLRSTVVGIIELEGHPQLSVIRERALKATQHHPVLRCHVEVVEGVAHLVELATLDFAKLVVEHFDVTDISAFAKDCTNSDFELNLPLWRLHIVRKSQRTFVVAALHHSISDGNGALALAGFLFDENQGIESQKVEFGNFENVEQQADKTKRALQPIIERALRDPVGLIGDINSVVSSLSRLLQIPQISSLRSTPARGANFEFNFYQLEKSSVRSLIKGKGVTQHDALVAFVLKALWNYHNRVGTPLSAAHINIPVAMNVEDAASNRMIVARLNCSLDDANFDQLMQRSHETLRQWRAEPGLALAGQLVDASRLVPIDLLANAVKQADATISTLRGVPKLGHIDSHVASAIWPLVAPIGAAVSITSVGIGQSIYLCITWDVLAIDDQTIWKQVLTDTWIEIFGTAIASHEFAG